MSKESSSAEIASQIINKNVALAAGVGLLPVPVVDFVGISLINLNMLRELADTYGVPFSENLGKTMVASLLAGLGAGRLAVMGVASVAKFLPGLGTAFSAIALPTFAAASTYAIGRVFDIHFRVGGNFFDFNLKSKQEELKYFYEEGRKAALADMEAKAAAAC